MFCKQSGVIICHVKGPATFDAAHVQRAFAAFSVKVLIIDLACAALAAMAHFFFCFQLCKVSIYGAQTDFFISQCVRDLPCGQQLVQVLAQIGKQNFPLSCAIVQQVATPPICDLFADYYTLKTRKSICELFANCEFPMNWEKSRNLHRVVIDNPTYDKVARRPSTPT